MSHVLICYVIKTQLTLVTQKTECVRRFKPLLLSRGKNFLIVQVLEEVHAGGYDYGIKFTSWVISLMTHECHC